MGITGGLMAPGKRRSVQDMAFYVALLNLGGPLVFKFVSGNLKGPSLCTVRRHRTRASHFRLNNTAGNVSEVSVMFC
jgi:hypothetical protein